MNTQEAFQLLALASARDGRTVDIEVATVWADDLSDIDLIEATEAAREHYRNSDDWLMPNHIRAGVKRARGSAQPPAFRELPRPGQFASAPLNMAAMTAAYQSGDRVAVDREVAVYEQQIGMRVHARRVGEVPR